MSKIKFSKDPKIRVVALKDFFACHDYFRNCSYVIEDWTADTIPDECETYKVFKNDMLIAIHFGMLFTNFGMSSKEKLEYIEIAYRDGKTEYELFDKELDRLYLERQKFKTSKKLDGLIEQTKKAKESLPAFCENEKVHVSPKKFEDYLIQTGASSDTNKYKYRYIVFDVETNGTRNSNDDLLSLSIYDPSTGVCYNRYFPLDLQPVILTSFVNGITDDSLKGATHITQDEMNQIIDYFDLKNSILLSFSGGKGTFDSSFVINYCLRHNVHGFEELQFRNIKELVPRAPFGSEGQLSKDNLCRLFGISGVTDIHSGMNDCILEWKLFEKLVGQPIFFIQNNIFMYSKDYIIPISYASRHPELLRYAGVKVPPVLGYPKVIFEYEFPKKVLKAIKKFPTNITGITIENAINSMLKVEEQDNRQFLIENKRHLKFIGSLDSRIEDIPIITENDGTVRTTDSAYSEYIDEVNEVTKTIMDNLHPTIAFIKNNIFNDQKILSQEMVISDDRKILALCDLSSSRSILEIKTMDMLSEDEYGKHIYPSISRQLYYQRNGRDVYALSVIFDTHYENISNKVVVDNLKIVIYEVDLKIVEIIPKIYKPGIFASKVLKALIEDNSLTYSKLAIKIGFSEKTIQNYIYELRDNGFIVREGLSNQLGVWRVLKDENGNPLPDDKQLKVRAIDHSLSYKNDVIEWTHGNIICTNYVNCKTNAEYECKVCGHKWSTRPEHFKHRQKHSCPKCKAGR